MSASISIGVEKNNLGSFEEVNQIERSHTCVNDKNVFLRVSIMDY